MSQFSLRKQAQSEYSVHSSSNRVFSWKNSRVLFAILATVALVSTMLTNIGNSQVANAVEHDGITVEFSSRGSAPTGTALTGLITISCERPSGCSGTEFTIQRPHMIADGQAVSFTLPSGVSYDVIDPLDGPNPRIRLNGLSTANYQIGVSWNSTDNSRPDQENSGAPGSEEVSWSATVPNIAETFSGTVPLTVTGTPETLISKETNNRSPLTAKADRPGQIVTYTFTYERRNGQGYTGVLGKLVDSLPAEVDFVRVVNSDLGEPNPNNLNTYFGSGSMLNSRLITVEDNNRTVSVALDKNLDSALARSSGGRGKIVVSILVRVNETAQAGRQITNTVRITNPTSVSGQPLTPGQNGVADSASAVMTPKDSGSGGAAKNSFIRSQVKVGQEVGYTVSVTTADRSDVTLVDTPRIQTCKKWRAQTPPVPYSQECQLGGGDGENHYDLDRLEIPALQLADGSGMYPLTVTFVNSAGEEDVHTLPQSTSAETQVVRPSDGFVVQSFKVEASGVDAGTQLSIRVFGAYKFPASIYDNNGSTLDYLEGWNDLTATVGGSTYTATDNYQVVPSGADPQIVFRNLNSRNVEITNAANGEKNPIKVRLSFGNSGSEPYKLDSYVAMPNGVKLDPINPEQYSSTYSWAKCDVANEGNPNRYDPSKLVWEKVGLSPSGGELWHVTTPEGMLVPGNLVGTEYNYSCAIIIKISYDGAAAGAYSGVPNSKFPAPIAIVGTGDPEQFLNGKSYQADTYGITCPRSVDNIAGTDPQPLDTLSGECDTTTRRFRTDKATVRIPENVVVSVGKSADGDKDEDGKISTYPAAGEGELDVSTSTREVVYMIHAGSAGSIALSNYVLYDALPAEPDENGNLNPITYNPESYSENSIGIRKSTLVPTLKEPLTLPNITYWDPEAKNGAGAWVAGQVPATVYYSTSINPCRPEMGQDKSAGFPTSSCTTYNANNDWHEADFFDGDFSRVRYIRIAFNVPIVANFDFPLTMNMPHNSAAGDGIGDEDIAINRVASRASSTANDKDIGVLGPRVARVQYRPEVLLNKSLLVPANPDGTCTPGTFTKYDGNNTDNIPALGEGDIVCFRLSVVGAIPDTVLKSPVLRDFIPSQLEFVDSVPESTVGTVSQVTEADGLSPVNVTGTKADGSTTTVIWKPGRINDKGHVTGGEPGNYTTVPARATLRMRVKSGAAPVPAVFNSVTGPSSKYSELPDCEPYSNGDDPEGDVGSGATVNCDTQPFRIAPSVSGSIFDGSDKTAGTVNQETTKTTQEIVVTLYDQQGNVVRDRFGRIRQITTTNGTFKFTGVEPGNYSVGFKLADASKPSWSFGENNLYAEGENVPLEPNASVDENDNSSPKEVRTDTFTVSATAHTPRIDAVIVPVKPDISITKSANPSVNPVVVGSTIDYTITVTNTGNVDLNTVKLTDQKLSDRKVQLTCNPGEGSTTGTDIASAEGGVLAVGNKAICTATYTVTQADIDGQTTISNTASVTGRSGTPENNDVKLVPPKTSTAEVPVAQANPAISLVKTVNGVDSVSLSVGQRAAFVVEVVNSGDVTLSNLRFTDEFTRLSGVEGSDVVAVAEPVMSCKVSESADFDSADGVDVSSVEIAPGQKLYCKGDYVVSQEFVDGQQTATNTASVIADPKTPGASSVSARDSVTVSPVASTVSMVVDKQVRSGDGWSKEVAGQVGAQIPFRFTVKNTGTVTLSSLSLSDVFKSGSSPEFTCKVVAGSDLDADGRVADTASLPDLAPGETLVCLTSSYTVTQADVDAQGDLVNTVSVTAEGRQPNADDSARPARSEGVRGESSAKITVPVGSAGLVLAKEVVDRKDLYLPGDVVSYKLTLTNNGNVTVTDPQISDPLAGTVSCDPEVSSLAPGGKLVCSAQVTVTEDMTASSTLKNTASGSGSFNNTPVRSNDSSTTVNIGQPGVSLTKQVAKEDGSAAEDLRAGEKVVYTLVATNTGSTVLTGVEVSDPMLADLACVKGGASGASPVSADLTELSPGESLTCSAQVTVTQDQVDAGQAVPNTAGVTGSTGRITVTDSAKANFTVSHKTQINLDKVVKDQKPRYTPGEDLSYTFTVRNTGDVTITGLVINDPMFANGDITCENNRLAPGESVECSSPVYKVTFQDLNNGEIVNTAVAEGNDPSNTKVSSDPATAKVKVALPVVPNLPPKPTDPTSSTDSPSDEPNPSVDPSNNSATPTPAVSHGDNSKPEPSMKPKPELPRTGAELVFAIPLALLLAGAGLGISRRKEQN